MDALSIFEFSKKHLRVSKNQKGDSILWILLCLVRMMLVINASINDRFAVVVIYPTFQGSCNISVAIFHHSYRCFDVLGK